MYGVLYACVVIRCIDFVRPMYIVSMIIAVVIQTIRRSYSRHGSAMRTDRTL